MAQNDAAHAAHCCGFHGCKYVDDDRCPVVKGKITREKDAGWCQEPELVDDPWACRAVDEPGHLAPSSMTRGEALDALTAALLAAEELFAQGPPVEAYVELPCGTLLFFSLVGVERKQRLWFQREDADDEQKPGHLRISGGNMKERVEAAAALEELYAELCKARAMQQVEIERALMIARDFVTSLREGR